MVSEKLLPLISSLYVPHAVILLEPHRAGHAFTPVTAT